MSAFVIRIFWVLSLGSLIFCAAFQAGAQQPPANFVWIPPGSFIMGSPSGETGRLANEGPQTQVTLTNGYWMSKYEVTQGDYLAVMGVNPSQFVGNLSRPVEQVSWYDAMNYCAKLTAQAWSSGQLSTAWVYRLPTEAEWEYACRAGTTTAWSFGNSSASLPNYGWFILNSGCQYTNDPTCSHTGNTHPVGQKLPNPWGLYDMHGNVAEWCLDYLGTYPGGGVTNPRGPRVSSSKVFRAPAWDFGDIYSRSAGRWGITAPQNWDNSIGFRVVLAKADPLGIATYDTASLQFTNIIHPSILRFNSWEDTTKQRHHLLVQIASEPSIRLRVFVQAVQDSGGHSHHDTPRKHGWLLRPELFPGNTWTNYPPFGKPTSGGTTDYSTYDSALVITNSPSGTTNLYYVAPEISGQEMLIVSTESPAATNRVAVTNFLTIQVPNLQSLSEGGTITNIGFRCAHPASHFGTTDMIQALQAFALNYWTETGKKLPVNDMSLPWGGMFDIGTNVCGGETAYNPFWESGKHWGHRIGIDADIGIRASGPSEITTPVFERIIAEQGWWRNDPALWVSDGGGSHHHLNLSGQGRVTIDSPKDYKPQVLSWNPSFNFLTFAVTNDNRGGLSANSVTVTSLSCPNPNVLLITGSPISLGSMQIREKKAMTLQAIVPKGVEQFFIRYSGTASSADRAGTFPWPMSALYLTKPIRVDAFTGLGAAQVRPLSARPGEWDIELTNPDQEAVVGSNLVYNAVIDNKTGAKIFLNNLAFQFTTVVDKSGYILDWSPQFLNTGGVVPTNGYTGPLFTLLWLTNPPVGSINPGQLILDADSPSVPSTASATFTSPYLLQRLQIRSASNSVVISWSSLSTNFVLEASDGLEGTGYEGPEWYQVGLPVVLQGSTNSVTIPSSGLKSFFRLHGS